MMSTVARSGLRFARPSHVRAFAAPTPWGTDHWRHDKKAFINWCTDAVGSETNQAKREFYGFVSVAFGDVDTDKDGKINVEQFDRLMEKVAAIPRRYGLAPLSTDDYATRLAQHKVLFDAIDTKEGSKRGFIAMDQFVAWAFDHVVGKVATIPSTDVNPEHVEDYSEKQYLEFIEVAVNNPGSHEHASFYNFILSCFVEADTDCHGRITFDQFDGVLCRAAMVPRYFGLAPAEGDAAMRKKMFEAMEVTRDGKGTGYVTFRKFWEWTTEHVAMKIELQKAGKGWRENH